MIDILIKKKATKTEQFNKNQVSMTLPKRKGYVIEKRTQIQSDKEENSKSPRNKPKEEEIQRSERSK